MQTTMPFSLRLVINKLFTWPPTLLAKSGNKEVDSEICKEIHRELRGEGDACSTWCSQHKACCSRAVRIQKESYSAVSAESTLCLSIMSF